MLQNEKTEPNMEYIEEGWREKPRQRSSHLFGDRIYSVPYRASCFASVDLEEKVEFILFFQLDQGKTASVARNVINSAPQTDAMTFAFASVPILLLYPNLF